MNRVLALSVIENLLARGVREFCVCPGARNAPLVAILKEGLSSAKFELNSVRTYYFYEERSAAFFALGCIRRTGAPVAVITTSGTAAGELLPATMEAHYSGLPLILVTADRPKVYRGSGAPQSAEQVNLFGIYVAESWDLDEGDAVNLGELRWDRPVHLNVCFEEPLLENSSSQFSREISSHRVQALASLKKGSGLPLAPLEEVGKKAQEVFEKFFRQIRHPFVVVGMLQPAERKSVVQLLAQWKFPVYFEATSGLRENPILEPFRVSSADKIMERAQAAGYPIDGVIRIGGIPTFRFWRDLELKYPRLEVVSISRLPFSGLARSSTFICGELPDLTEKILASEFIFKAHEFIAADRKIQRRFNEILASEPRSEPALIATLSKRISNGSQVYVGNSLPIREWDLAADFGNKNLEVWASRGLNGIDGQVSTFLGFARSDCENWAVIGDLTALYDLPGPWALSQRPDIRVNLLVVNNGGGKIFSRMFPYVEFQNNHQIRFKPWADLWGIKYEEWKDIPENLCGGAPHRLIELLPDEEATQRFWKKISCE